MQLWMRAGVPMYALEPLGHHRGTHSTVILGLVPRSQRSAGDEYRDRRDTWQRGIEVDPMRVGAFDEVDLPLAHVVLQGLLALDGVADVGELFVPDEHVHAVLPREGRALAGPMLLNAKNNPLVTPM